MFKSKPNYRKLKTNLRLAVNRLKMLEKKKTELALKSRKEISEYIQAGKDDRAKIRVEHIIREDFLVEGMEIVEMFCDMLLARFGILEKIFEVDPSVEEAIASIVWAEPRLSSDVPELHEITKNLYIKYGKEFGDACRCNVLGTVNDKLMKKLSIYAPPKILIENYMIEIAKSFGVPYTPDPHVMLGDAPDLNMAELVDLSCCGNSRPPGPSGGGSGGGGGAMAYHLPAPTQPFPGPQSAGYPPFGSPAFFPPPSADFLSSNPQSGFGQGHGGSGIGFETEPVAPAPSLQNNIPAGGIPVSSPGPGRLRSGEELPTYSQLDVRSGDTEYATLTPQNDLSTPSVLTVGKKDGNLLLNIPNSNGSASAPLPPHVSVPLAGFNRQPPANHVVAPAGLDLPELPSVPHHNWGTLPNSNGSPKGGASGNDIDFDDLSARFEALKKQK